MSERKWTPGPWRVERDEYSGIEKYGVYASDETPVVSHFTAIEDEPDSHIIAAAPDLYDALQAMVDYCNAECGSKIYPGHQANQALAKARGETQ